MPEIIPAYSTYTIPDRDRWVPKVKAGHFYIGDRQYYLFADKKTVRLEQCRRMRVALAGHPSSIDNVYIDGVPYTNYTQEGSEIVLNLEDIETYIAYWAQFVWDSYRWGYFDAGFILTDDTQVTVEYSVLTWNAATHSFTQSGVTQHTRFRDAEESYRLPDTPIPGTPIVITDDSKIATDERDYAIEYDVDHQGVITLNAPRNYAPNPNFEAAPTGHPELPCDWQLLDPTGRMRRYQGTGYVGLWTLWMQDPTGKARAVIPMVVDEPLAISVRARMSGTGHSGTGYLELAYKDGGGNILDCSGAHIGSDPDAGPYSVRSVAQLNGRAWSEISMVVGNNDDDDLEPTDCRIPIVGAVGVEEIEVRLHGTGTGPLEFDSVQVEKSSRVSQYGYIGPASTVEYEVSPTGIYRPDPTGKSWPFAELCHVDLNAASEEAHAGFLTMEEFSDHFDEDLTIGGPSASDPTGIPRGIVPHTGMFWEFGRRNLPYARMNGRTKLRNRYPLRLLNQAYNEPVNPYQDPRDPVFAQIVPPDNTRRDVGGQLHMSVKANTSEMISCIFTDSEGNPVIHERIIMQVTGTGTVDPTGVYTNDAGRVLVTYAAPSGAVPAESAAVLSFTHELSGLSEDIDVDLTS